jgi:hypothetical protein
VRTREEERDTSCPGEVGGGVCLCGEGLVDAEVEGWVGEWGIKEGEIRTSTTPVNPLAPVSPTFTLSPFTNSVPFFPSGRVVMLLKKELCHVGRVGKSRNCDFSC